MNYTEHILGKMKHGVLRCMRCNAELIKAGKTPGGNMPIYYTHLAGKQVYQCGGEMVSQPPVNVTINVCRPA